MKEFIVILSLISVILAGCAYGLRLANKEKQIQEHEKGCFLRRSVNWENTERIMGKGVRI